METQACPDKITVINLIRSPLIIRTVSEAFLFSAIRRDPFHSSARHGSRDVSNCLNLRSDCWEICCSFCNCLQPFWTSFLEHSDYSRNIPTADEKGSQPVSLNQSSVHYRDFQSFTLDVSSLCYCDVLISWIQISNRIYTVYTWKRRDLKRQRIE